MDEAYITGVSVMHDSTSRSGHLWLALDNREHLSAIILLYVHVIPFDTYPSHHLLVKITSVSQGTPIQVV